MSDDKKRTTRHREDAKPETFKEAVKRGRDAKAKRDSTNTVRRGAVPPSTTREA